VLSSVNHSSSGRFDLKFTLQQKMSEPTTTSTIAPSSTDDNQQQPNVINTSDTVNENNKREREPEIAQSNKKRKTELLASLKQTVSNASSVLGKDKNVTPTTTTPSPTTTTPTTPLSANKQQQQTAGAVQPVKKSQRTRKPNTKYEDEAAAAVTTPTTTTTTTSTPSFTPGSTSTSTSTGTSGTTGGTMDKQHHRMCMKLLSNIKNHRWAWPFNQPVDPEKLGIPDYLVIIKIPMDLGTVEKKLINEEYPDIYAFASDVRLVWQNCLHYNQPGSDVVRMAECLRDLFENKFMKIEERVNGIVPSAPVAESKPTQRRASKSSSGSASKPKGGRKKSTSAPVPELNISETDSRPMTFQDMKNLSTQIEQLTSQDLARVVDIIRSRAPKASSQANNSEIEIDLDALDPVTLRILESFVNECMNVRRQKAEARSRAANRAAETRRLNKLKKEQAAEAESATASSAALNESTAQESGSDTQESGEDTGMFILLL
jgi:hypothetical protein